MHNKTNLWIRNYNGLGEQKLYEHYLNSFYFIFLFFLVAKILLKH